MIFLVDCNNFYVSCERLFNPKLENKPVVVLSNNDGCVIARSQEAKKIGIAMGAPFFEIKELCKVQGVVVLSSNYSLYGHLSERVMLILKEMADDLEVYSIDEAFLTYETSSGKEAINFAKKLRQKIKSWVGIPVSIGIAKTKTLAKVASELAKKKPDGVFSLISEEKQNVVLPDFLVEDIWGISSGLKKRLNVLAIFTAEQLKRAEPYLIRKKLGVVGERILRELNNISCLHLEEVKNKKSITSSRSFGKPLSQFEDIAEALSTYVNTASIKLRKQKLLCQGITVFVETYLQGVRIPYSITLPFPYPTQDTSTIMSLAKRCLKHLIQENTVYKKCGVILLDLMPSHNLSFDLFFKANEKRDKVMHTLDAVNARFGKNTLFFGAMGVNSSWKMRAHNRTPQYLTCWNELPVVKA